MNDDFTFTELRSIHRISEAVRNLDRGITVHFELPGMLIHELVEADTANVAMYCTSLLPNSCLDSLAQRVSELEAENYFGRLFYIGPGLSESEQQALQPRFRAACQSNRSYLDAPATPNDMPELPIDIFWHSLLNTAVQPEQCKHDNCTDPRIKNSGSAHCITTRRSKVTRQNREVN